MRAPSLKAADFQRALGSRPVARTAHFVLHILPRVGQSPLADGATATHLPLVLSTSADAAEAGVACELVTLLTSPIDRVWRLGLVLPKKQAKRAVTRSLIRHQVREALLRHAPVVRSQGRFGDEVDGWVVRLRAPFDRKQFPSAASAALQALVRQEMDELWSRLAPKSPSKPTDPSRGAA